MYILPYYESKTIENSLFKLKCINLFLIEKGKGVWQTDEKKPSLQFVISNYLEPNGLVGECSVKGDTVLCKIDLSSVDMNSFYTFVEQDKAEEVWRPFYKIEEAGWEEQAQKESLGSFGSLKKMWDLIK